MRQQINLYQPVFRQEHKPFSATTFAVFIGVAAVALAAFSVHATVGLKQLEQQVAAVREQQAQQQRQLEAASALQSARGSTAEIEARVQTLTATLTERTNALRVLQSGGAGQTKGFAARMQALASRHVAGLWIDSLMMSGTDGTMSLSGGTIDADIVPAYLQGLSRESVLSGTRFDDFVIERPADEDEQAKAEQKTESQRKAVPIDHVRFRAGTRSSAAKPTEAAT